MMSKPHVMFALLAAGLLALAAGASVLKPCSPRRGSLTPYPTASYFDALSAEFYEGRFREAAKTVAGTNDRRRWSPAIAAPDRRDLPGDDAPASVVMRWATWAAAWNTTRPTLKLFLAFPDWMNQATGLADCPGRANLARGSLGISGRRTRRGPPIKTPWGSVRKPAMMMFDVGGNDSVVLQLHAQEIVRCTTLAIRRRAMLLGPAARKRPDQPGAGGVGTASGPARPLAPGLDRPGVGRGAGRRRPRRRGPGDAPPGRPGWRAIRPSPHRQRPAAIGPAMRCPRQLGRSRQVLCRGHLCRGPGGRFRRSGRGLPLGAVAHFASNRRELYPPLKAALAWSSRPRCGRYTFRCALGRGELRPSAPAPRSGHALAGGPRRRDSRHDLRPDGRPAEPSCRHRPFPGASLARGRGWPWVRPWSSLRKGSVWLFQMATVDGRCAGGTGLTGDHDALDLLRARVFAIRSRWIGPPIPSSRSPPWRRRTTARWSTGWRRHPEKRLPPALEIADRLRRHRFYASLPYGGRLVALRWLLELPESALGPKRGLRGRSAPPSP